MVLHDVADGARLIIEGPPPLNAEVLGHRDLHASNMLVIPDRFEETIAESEVGQIEQRLLAEVVINAIHPVLREDRVQIGVELHG